MFSSARPLPHGLSRGLVLAALLAAVPAHAAGTGRTVTVASVLTDAQRLTGDAGILIAAYWRHVVAGDMAAIQNGTFAFSGLIALIALWLLVRRPRGLELDRVALEPHEIGRPETEPAPRAQRPRRLLEAIAAAKAQMAISVAERKHIR